MFLTDLSRLKHLEAQLLQAQRLEALSELTAAIAHDVNNFLAAARGHAELAQVAGQGAAAPLGRHLSEVGEALDGAAALNKRLLRLGRPAEVVRQQVDLNQVLESTAVLLRPVLRRRVRLACEPYRQPVPVEADPRHLEQILVNLAINARDAMPEGGELVLGTGIVEGEPEPSGPGEVADRRHLAALTVTDTGTGIPQEQLERIFEPFFTTKPPDRGTGLGLAVVASLVEDHAGHIMVESTPGVGTTFRVLLPLAANGDGVDGSGPRKVRAKAHSPVWSFRSGTSNARSPGST